MKPSIQALLQTGFKALNNGDIVQAGKACQQAIEQQPDAPEAHFLVALVALEAEDRANAHRAFRSVIALDNDHAAAWAHLARLNASEGRVQQAERALRELRRIKPSDPVVLDLMGTVLTQLGEYEAAKAFLHAPIPARRKHPNS